MADDKRAPGTDEERAARLAKMMESQLQMEAPETVGLRTGYKYAYPNRPPWAAQHLLCVALVLTLGWCSGRRRRVSA
eukprot:COSAG02_NODE_1812_length_10792_cov_36.615205_3_plen_77_part_00